MKITRASLKILVIVHPHPPPSRGRELIRYSDKYSPSTGGRGLGGGGAELLQILFIIGLAILLSFLLYHLTIVLCQGKNYFCNFSSSVRISSS